MEGVIVTSSPNVIMFDLNDFTTALGYSKAFWMIQSVSKVVLHADHVEVELNTQEAFRITNALSPEYLKVKEVNGVAPASLEDLYNKVLATVM